MKVLIKRKDNDKFPVDVECKKCKTVLRLEGNEDVKIGEGGRGYFVCPVCENKTLMTDVVAGNYDLKLTKDNILFPDHFYDYKDAVDITPEMIKKIINHAIDYLRYNPDKIIYYEACGNTFCLVQNMPNDNCYDIEISKDFYSVEIPYEDSDLAIHNK